LFSKRRIRKFVRRIIASAVGVGIGLIPAWFLLYDLHTAKSGVLYFARWLWLILTVQFFLLILVFAWVWAVWTNRIYDL
jgi:Kef-type K+ transport system membrane component KefB